MDQNRHKLLIVFITIFAAGLSLAISLLQILYRLPAVISSVSWNL